MTTTELYSGYTEQGKPSSRVLRPPGGQSSNIFGDSEPNPQEQVRREQRQAPPPAQQGGAGNATNDAQQEYQRNKPQGKGEAPFATFQESGKNSTPSQFDSCDPGSQNDADFRCYSVSDYRNAVVQNAAIRQRAGQATSAFNPITHEESAGGSPQKEYNQSRPHPQQVIQHQQQQQQQQQPARMVRGQNNHASGKVNYNPITGEEYPADYGKQNEEEVAEKKTEEESQEENNELTEEKNELTEEKNELTEENAEKSSPAASKPEQTTPTPAPAAPFQKVRHPPGGKSSGPLW